MCSGRRRPLVPIISSVKYWEGTVSRMKVFIILQENPRKPEPSTWPLHASHRSPEYDSMLDSELCEHTDFWFDIDLLDDHTIERAPKDPTSPKKLISRTEAMNHELGIFLIIIKPYPRTRSVVAIISRNERTKKSFQGVLFWGKKYFYAKKCQYSSHHFIEIILNSSNMFSNMGNIHDSNKYHKPCSYDTCHHQSIHTLSK